jgi:parallel beta-helix repeat protein
MLTLILLPLLGGLIMPGSSFGATYYVAQDGNDNNTGTSWKSAWRHPQHAANKVKPGDVVIIRAGNRPYNHLRIVTSGEKDWPIVFKGESPEQPPVISGVIPSAEWSGPDKNGVWQYAARRRATQVRQNNIPLPRASSRLCRDGNWYWENDVLYYRPANGTPENQIIWRDRGGGVNIGAHSWIVLEDLKLVAGMGSGVSIRGGKNNIVRRVHVKWHWRGVNVNGGNNNLIENCVVEENREGIYLENRASHNIVRNCRAIRNGNYPQYNTGDRHGIAVGGLGPLIGNVVENCEITQTGGPPGDPALIAFDAPQSVFQNNHVHDNYGSGLFITLRSHNSRVLNNIVERNGIGATRNGHKGISGLSVNNSKNVVVAGNRILNNIVSPDSRWPGVYPGLNGGLNLDGAKGYDMSGITIRNNEVSGTVGGPDVHLSNDPDTSGLIVEPANQAPLWLNTQ